MKKAIWILALTAMTGWVSVAAEPDRDMRPIDITGRASEFFHTRNWRVYYWRQDISFLLADKKTGKTWRIISRDGTPYEARWYLGPTYTGLKVDWKSRPRLRVIGLEGIDRPHARFYDLKLNGGNIGTALVIQVETGPGTWKEFYVNNWFHHWGDAADRAIYGFYAGKKSPYEICGWVHRNRGPYERSSRALIKKFPEARVFRGYVHPAKGSEFGYEIKVVNLMGKETRTRRPIMLYGNDVTVPALDKNRPDQAEHPE
ncbi:MAG: hypothetical protein QF886_00220 [Planctomycetota bacterium]|nr:hypothetical protein [Planctomycetota bacterium]